MTETMTDEVKVVIVDGQQLRKDWRAQLTRPTMGWVLMALGAMFIIVGYFGVAHEAVVAKQLPYLVSGGIGGMVLVAVGAFLLGTDDVRRQLSKVEHLEEMVAELHGTLLTVSGSSASWDAPVDRAVTPAPTNTRRVPEPVAARGSDTIVLPVTSKALVALARGRNFHTADCTLVAGKATRPVDARIVEERKLVPCRLCDPSSLLG